METVVGEPTLFQVDFGQGNSGFSNVGFAIKNPNGTTTPAPAAPRTHTGVAEVGSGVYEVTITFAQVWTGYIEWDSGGALANDVVREDITVVIPGQQPFVSTVTGVTPNGQWRVQGIATDGTLISFPPEAALEFAANSFGESVSIAAYQHSTHAQDTSGDHICSATHLNNTQFVSSTQLKINGSAPQTITTSIPSPVQVPLLVTFNSTRVVTISNVAVQAYNLTWPNIGVLAGVDIRALEQGVWTSWKNINGTSAQLTAGSGASTYTWRLGLSASPTSGNSKVFGLRFSLTWI